MNNKPVFFGAINRPLRAARSIGLAVVLGAWAFAGHAASQNASFNVVVNLLQPDVVGVLDTGTCSMVGAFGASVTVSCSPGAIRFITMFPDTEADILRGAKSSHAGDRIATSWRRITLERAEYLELMVRW